ncbi:MAG: prepilin-type N-terminal cleavage/methylation domain-containing protein [Candidatus Nomurabacteria bacterium]|nr:prepilin-type N-terminal cleavage/methylation domain-containing protein [Candidatus Nomurabacteria bacterium]
MKNFFIKKNKKNYISKKGGFTIVETMIAVALFTIIMIIGIGALLNASNYHKKSQKFRSIMDNLSFVMEDMSRSLRTGSNYHCGIDSITLAVPDCGDNGPLGTTLAFQDATLKWQYYAFTATSDNRYNDIIRSFQSETLADLSLMGTVTLNPAEVKLDSNSGFIVRGAELGSADNIQPYIIIRLSGVIFTNSSGNNDPIPFSLETSVSQRLIDVDQIDIGSGDLGLGAVPLDNNLPPATR